MPTRVKELHSIMPIANMASVMVHGILSHNKCQKFEHADISSTQVQDKRKVKEVPNGLKLHDYANLYFSARNPMMYKRQTGVEDLCVLQVSLEVTKQSGVVYTDQNAASRYVKFLSGNEIKQNINFNWVFADDWNDADQIVKWQKSSVKCAEILIPYFVDAKYITGAYVVNRNSQENLLKQGFTLPISVNLHMFFR